MKNRWKQRALALITALALSITLAAGLAETLVAAEPSEPPVYADQEQQAVEAGESDLDELYAEDGEARETATPEATLPADDGQITGNALPTEDTSLTEETPVPEETPEAPVETEGGVEGATETPEPSGDTSDPGLIEDAEGSPAPEGGEVAENAPDPEASEVPEDEPDPEASELPEVSPSPEASETPAATPAPEAQATETPAPQAAEIVAADISPKLALEGAAAFAFPLAKLSMGKGEWIDWVVQTPNGIDPAQVAYVSSKPSIVKVEAPGVLHARKKGSAKITATAPDGQIATCKITVKKAPKKVTLSPKKVIFGIGEARTLKAKLTKGSASARMTWTSSNPAVCTVDAYGNLLGVGVGTSKITAKTYNGKRASRTVTVLGGRTPTAMGFPMKTLYLGLKEKQWLNPLLGEGEAALFTFSSSKKSIVSVSPRGLLTAKKKGTSYITVKTHNGLKTRLTVKVIKAPTKVTLSETKLTIETGQTATLAATVPSGTASAITWTSSDPNIATVDAAGNVTGVNAGSAKITAKTFNGKSASCTVTVKLPPTAQEVLDRTPPNLTNAQMAENIRNGSFGGSKKNSLANIVELMLNAGYEPTFAAGVAANVYSEGTYGLFESSKYVANYQKRPRYFCYLDGGDYYTLQNGQYVLTAVYLSPEEIASYTGSVPAKRRFGEEKYYWNKWSGQYVWNINLLELKAFMDLLTASAYADGTPDGSNKGWDQGKFGLGCTQWTGGRTRKLLAKYLKYSGGGPSITKDQVIAAEHEQILEDLGGDYKSVYTGWRKENVNALYGLNAAYSAGSWVCLKYEIPANKMESAVKRGNNAKTIYSIMTGRT